MIKWAHSENANLKEPLEDLKERGWQYGDIPTASNFNWLFNEIQKELEVMAGDIKQLKDKVSAVKIIAQTGSDLGTVNKTNIESQEIAVRQICRHLREMEKEIRKYYPGFPTQPWPLNDAESLTTNEETNNNI